MDDEPHAVQCGDERGDLDVELGDGQSENDVVEVHSTSETVTRIRNVTRGNLPLHGYATDIGIGRYTEPRRNVRLSVTWSL